MSDDDAERTTLHRYLQDQREVMLFKLDGLDERQLRWPATPTGTSLLGLVKHLTWTELGYLGECLDRPLDHPWPWEAAGAAPDSASDPDPEGALEDQWVRADESPEDIVDGYRRAWAHGDAAIFSLPLSTTGEVSWWSEERRRPTLHTLLIHLVAETARHAGHADIIREGLDGSTGMRAGTSNLPPLTQQQWAEHRDRLRAIAEGA
ncbi:hypothetical protein BH708_00380 [Brachybacterium sp. P6-10-X1]|uniref:DinB family protein n=1 Tax=Brachybacterium sp. P6-10-X1 TaxID=1903186 RepID=UPI0009719405|nr:DinB family protein [Brachybacterium sp. P6-10-X1]APX31438.1 hypothetical protein BH708_00380 [Brachybacterium sp. P6-10-X1]